MITLAGILLSKVMALVRIRKVLQSTYSEFMPWKSLAGTLMAAMIAAIPSIILNAKLAAPVLVLLPISATLYMLSYAALILIFGLLTKGEIESIKKLLCVWNRRTVVAAYHN